jgi:hypothetical protein
MAASPPERFVKILGRFPGRAVASDIRDRGSAIWISSDRICAPRSSSGL